MRPRKVILCVDANELALSVRSFLLETRGFRVLRAASGVEALATIRKMPQGSIHLLLADLFMAGIDGNKLVRSAKKLDPTLPAMIISEVANSFEGGCSANAFLPRGAYSPAAMLECARILTARKRGPKVGSRYAVVKFSETELVA